MSEDFSQTGSNPDRTAEFLRLYTLHQPRLFAYVLTMIPKWHDAEEVLQETSVVLWQAFGQFQLGTDFRAWANKTALNQVLSFRKRHKRLAVPLSERFVEAIARECDKQADALDEELAAMVKCVDKLPPDERELITECYEPNVTIKEVAERFGRPAGTVYKSLTRIRRELMKCIERTISEGGRR